MNRYQAGALVRITGSFTDMNGAAIDPTTVSLVVEYPDDTQQTFVYPAGVTKDSVGTYHKDIDTTAKPGNFKYKWVSTGTGQAAGANAFAVYEAIS